MPEQSTDDGFAQWWKTLQADPRRPTAVATMSKKTARAGWSAALAACEARLAEAHAVAVAAEALWSVEGCECFPGSEYAQPCKGCGALEINTAWMQMIDAIEAWQQAQPAARAQEGTR